MHRRDLLDRLRDDIRSRGIVLRWTTTAGGYLVEARGPLDATDDAAWWASGTNEAEALEALLSALPPAPARV